MLRKLDYLAKEAEGFCTLRNEKKFMLSFWEGRLGIHGQCSSEKDGTPYNMLSIDESWLAERSGCFIAYFYILFNMFEFSRF